MSCSHYTQTQAVVIIQFHTACVEREFAVKPQPEHNAQPMEARVMYSIQLVDLSLISFSNSIKVRSAKQSRSRETMTDLLSSRGANVNYDHWITFIEPKATRSPLRLATASSAPGMQTTTPSQQAGQ
jgi:hypothetical protein